MSRGVEATCDAPAEASLNAITVKPDKQEGYQMHLPATHCSSCYKGDEVVDDVVVRGEGEGWWEAGYHYQSNQS
ncbi:hypothetical protein CDAR_236451 [Caerostris darwini]|uniref:Uncharacterized protein n=1 Tax=Caerostris darwini TaxID=1538125 RepID=A0AAV4T7X0_9ARAC|nr:hypothetical protein CDAR_236451 [Caerostris darwini]